MKHSIKLKLVVWFLSLFFVLLTGLGLFLNTNLEKIVLGSIDSHLHSEVQLIAGLIEYEEDDEDDEHGEFELELTEAEVGDYALPLSGNYYQVVSSEGKIIGRSPSLSQARESLPLVGKISEPDYKNIIGPNGEPLRLLSEAFELTSNLTVIVQASESLEASYKLLNLFKNTLLLLFPLTFVVSGLGIYILTGFSLKPLKDFSNQVGDITEKDLNVRISEVTASELRPLAKSFNTMLSRLEKSFESQQEFFSNASHELRTPTSVIKSTADVTLLKNRSAEDYIEALNKIEETSRKLSKLIDKILEVSRLESKAFSLNIEELDINEILKDVIKLVKPTALKKNIAVNLQDKSLKLEGDRVRLIEAFTNVIDNAIKYNKMDGTININIRESDDKIHISVEDTGIGIPESELGKVFERFHRVDLSREEIPGSGLGLPIVRAIVSAHNGEIDISSQLDKGTVFRVSLPQKI